MHTTFTVTQTFTVTAKTLAEVESAVSSDDYSEVDLDLDKTKTIIEPTF